MHLMDNISNTVIDTDKSKTINNEPGFHFEISSEDVCKEVVSKEELLKQAEQLIDYYMSRPELNLITVKVDGDIYLGDIE